MTSLILVRERAPLAYLPCPPAAEKRIWQERGPTRPSSWWKGKLGEKKEWFCLVSTMLGGGLNKFNKRRGLKPHGRSRKKRENGVLEYAVTGGSGKTGVKKPNN